MAFTVLSQPAAFDAEEELLDDEALEAEEEEEAVADDDEDVPAVDTRSLLDSPDGSISHADLG